MNRKKLKKEHLNYIYFESHHIIPKCMGGTNKKENLVLLTAKEHFIAHMLLIEIYRNSDQINKLIFALSKMCCKNKNNQRIYSASQYAYARKLQSTIKLDENRRRQLSEKRKKQIDLGNKIVYQFDFKMNFIKKWNSIKEASLTLNPNGHPNTISKCANGHTKTSLGFIWRFEQNQQKIDYEEIYKADYEKMINDRRMRLKGKTGKNHPVYNRCWIKKENKSKMIKKDELDIFLNDGWTLGKKELEFNKRAREIHQFDLNMNYIICWKSVAAAKKFYKKGDISSCLNGRTETAAGFIWKYKNENE